MPELQRKEEFDKAAERHLHGDHKMLGYSLDKLEGQMNERLSSMQDFFVGEVRDLRSFIIKALVWLAGPLAFSVISLFGWEWYQVKAAHTARLETAQMVTRVVQQQEDMTSRLEDLKDFSQSSISQSDEKNKAFIDALNTIVNQHLNGTKH